MSRRVQGRSTGIRLTRCVRGRLRLIRSECDACDGFGQGHHATQDLEYGTCVSDDIAEPLACAFASVDRAGPAVAVTWVLTPQGDSVVLEMHLDPLDSRRRDSNDGEESWAVADLSAHHRQERPQCVRALRGRGLEAVYSLADMADVLADGTQFREYPFPVGVRALPGANSSSNAESFPWTSITILALPNSLLSLSTFFSNSAICLSRGSSAGRPTGVSKAATTPASILDRHWLTKDEYNPSRRSSRPFPCLPRE